MKILRFALLACVAVLTACSVARSASPTAVLSWTAPTTYTDGSAIPSTETITYSVYQGPSGNEGTVAIASGISALTYTATSNLTAGSTVCWTVTATDVQKGSVSAPTNEVCKTFAPLVPGSPTGLSVK